MIFIVSRPENPVAVMIGGDMWDMLWWIYRLQMDQFDYQMSFDQYLVRWLQKMDGETDNPW